MALKSMTGFARADGVFEDVSWHWELRSVNGRGRDIRFRAPFGFEALDQPVRKACAQLITRGNCNISLNVTRETGQMGLALNTEALSCVIEAAKTAQTLIDAKPPTIDGLLAIKGVMERAETTEDEERITDRNAVILASFDAALGDLITARQREGSELSAVLRTLVDEIEKSVEEVENAPQRTAGFIRQRLQKNLERLLGDSDTLDPERLHQEAVLLATKADVEEELQRLRSHIVAARELFDQDGPMGRKLDFLTQEFNREANTLCSKSNAAEITKTGLELKSYIDQLREQVQNIE